MSNQMVPAIAIDQLPDLTIPRIGPAAYDAWRDYDNPGIDEVTQRPLPKTKVHFEPEGPMMLTEWTVPKGSRYLISPILQPPIALAAQPEIGRFTPTMLDSCYVAIVPTEYCELGHILKFELAWRLCVYCAHVNKLPQVNPWYNMCTDALDKVGLQMIIVDIPDSAQRRPASVCGCMDDIQLRQVQEQYIAARRNYEIITAGTRTQEFYAENFVPGSDHARAMARYESAKHQSFMVLQEASRNAARLFDPIMADSSLRILEDGIRRWRTEVPAWSAFYFKPVGLIERFFRNGCPRDEDLEALYHVRVLADDGVERHEVYGPYMALVRSNLVRFQNFR